jgi:hypothetical protein
MMSMNCYYYMASAAPIGMDKALMAVRIEHLGSSNRWFGRQVPRDEKETLAELNMT